tara:strand:- start:4535 stop:4813 length:279 start_codon:yes stop_codon:yes gene_type:complete
MYSALHLFDTIINLFIWAIILGAILSWLIGFNVVNINNRIVYLIAESLNKLTEPFLRPIRNLLPNLGGLDLSPIILILLLIFFRNLVFEYLY